jgi:hypothetical protein
MEWFMLRLLSGSEFEVFSNALWALVRPLRSMRLS